MMPYAEKAGVKGTMTYQSIYLSKSTNISGSHAFVRGQFNNVRQLLAKLDVTTAASSNSPKLDVSIQQSLDGGTTWASYLAYTQVTTSPANQTLTEQDATYAAICGDLRLRWAVTGGAAHGTLLTAPAGSNNDQTWTGKAAVPSDDNDVSVTVVDPGVAGALAVDVVAHDITVTLARNSGSKATLTTAMTGSNNDITLNALTAGTAGNSIALVLSNGAAHAATTCSVTGTTATVLLRSAITRASLTTALAGANNDLVYSAVTNGTAGNSVHIVYVVAGTNTALSVGVVGSVITVNVATNGGGTATSTATQVKAAVDAFPAAHALVTVALAGTDTGAGVVTALADTPLAGGDDKSIVATGNEVALVLQRNADFKLLATAEIKSGDDGTGVVTALASTPLAGGLASAITTTAAQVATAVAANTAANALVGVANTGGDTGAGLMTALAKAYLSNFGAEVYVFTLAGFAK